MTAPETYTTQIANTFLQPALLTSALLLEEMPAVKKLPDRVLEVVLTHKPADETTLPSWQMATFLSPVVPHQSRGGLNFRGSLNQVHTTFRHILAENIAAGVFYGHVGQLKAEQALAAVPAAVKWMQSEHGQYVVGGYGKDEIVPREKPLLVTTDKMYAPADLSGRDDFAARKGRTFDYYKQDWQDGLRNAEDYFTDEEKNDKLFQMIMATLRANAFDAVYPSCFFAAHRVAQITENGAIGSMDVWDIGMAEPHGVRDVLCVGSEEEVHVALSVLNDGFIYDYIRGDERHQKIKEFNTLHYDVVFGEKSVYFPDRTRSQAMDFLMRDIKLS